MLHPRFCLVLVQKAEHAPDDTEHSDEAGVIEEDFDRIRDIHIQRSIILALLYLAYICIFVSGICIATIPKHPAARTAAPPLLIVAVVLRVLLFVCVNYVWGIGSRIRLRFYNECKWALAIVYQTVSNLSIVISVVATTALICGIVGFVFLLVISFDARMARNRGFVISTVVLCAVACLSLLVNGVQLRICEFMGYVRVAPTIQV